MCYQHGDSCRCRLILMSAAAGEGAAHGIIDAQEGQQEAEKSSRLAWLANITSVSSKLPAGSEGAARGEEGRPGGAAGSGGSGAAGQDARRAAPREGGRSNKTRRRRQMGVGSKCETPHGGQFWVIFVKLQLK